MRILRVSSWPIDPLVDWLFFLFVWTTYLVLRRLPFNGRSKITCVIAFVVYWLWKDGRIRIKRNISLLRPDLNNREINRASWWAVKTIARSWAAMLGNEFTSLKEINKRVEVQGIEPVLNRYHRGEKIIATAVHTGPIDEMIGAISRFKLRVYVPAEPVKPKWFFNLMMRLRLKGDIIYEPVERGETLARAAHHLSDGRIVLLVVDATSRDSSGVLCRIGGAETRFPVGAVKLAFQEDAAIFPVFPSRRQDGRAQIVVGPRFRLIKTGDRKRDIELNTRRLIEGVYAPHILKNLDNWLRLLWGGLKRARN